MKNKDPKRYQLKISIFSFVGYITIGFCYWQNKIVKKHYFWGNKSETLKAMNKILQLKTQWSDYMEQVLYLVTVN